jgi:hypothetical protein
MASPALTDLSYPSTLATPWLMSRFRSLNPEVQLWEIREPRAFPGLAATGLGKASTTSRNAPTTIISDNESGHDLLLKSHVVSKSRPRKNLAEPITAGIIGAKVRAKKRGSFMRDIRGDLQDRANIIASEINAARGQFDQLIEQLRSEHDGKVRSLRSHLDAILMVAGIEDRRLGGATSVRKADPQRKPRQQPRQQVHPQQAF